MATLLAAGLVSGCAAFGSPSPDTIHSGTTFVDSDAGKSADSETSADASSIDDPIEDVTILYTNDVHTYIANEKKNEDDSVTRLPSYASVAALRDELEARGESVILVDAGDHAQGTAFGSMDEGRSVIGMMNAAGYQLATLGNHEFDYGQFRVFQMMDEADFPYISCNFFSLEENRPVLDASKIFEIGGRRVAFVGICTPESIIKSTPTYFQDASGNYIYDFSAGNDGADLYEAVQAAIDDVRDEVDFVIALGHLGVDPSAAPYRSIDVIANVTGLDAFIDGHSHTTMPCEMVEDAEGKQVLLSQTGCYFAAIGKITLSADGSISSELITDYDSRDASVDALEQAWIDDVNGRLGEVIAELPVPMYINDPEQPEMRIVRRMETNLGDLVTDAFYYFFNESQNLDCDLALVNGGGVRSSIDPGEVTYLTAKTVNPFGNVACLVEANGQDILDALEMGAAGVGLIDPATDKFYENGGFLHVAGMTYEIDTAVESTIKTDDNGTFVGGPEKYRVQNVKVYNRKTGVYEPLDLSKTYRIAGLNYILRNGGNGLSMFADSVCILDYVGEDYLIFAEYLKSFESAEDGLPLIATENSPLASYSGYLLDYENPFGSGRIVITAEGASR